MYGTFENLQMNNNLGRVGNNAYGALIGADFGLKELKNGWKFILPQLMLVTMERTRLLHTWDNIKIDVDNKF